MKAGRLESRQDGKTESRQDGKTEEGESEKTKKKVNVARLAEAVGVRDAKRSAKAKKAAENRGKGRTKPVRFPDLENESGSGLFASTGKARARMLAILSKGATSPERRALVAILGKEFRRQYTRWRTVNDAWFKLHSKEKRYTDTAAVLCVEREITPTRLFKYWAAHIDRFQLKWPTLSFLSSPANIDAAASFYALNGLDADPAAIRENSKQTNTAAGLHGYADTSKLHKGLRRELQAGGFDVSEWSDRDLMSIQNAAEAIAAGRRLFVSSTMRPMVDRALRLFEK